MTKREKRIRARSLRELAHLWAHGAAGEITLTNSPAEARGPWLYYGETAVAFRHDRRGKPVSVLLATKPYPDDQNVARLTSFAVSAAFHLHRVAVSPYLLNALHKFRGRTERAAAEAPDEVARLLQESKAAHGGKIKAALMAAVRSAGHEWGAYRRAVERTIRERQKRVRAELKAQARQREKAIREMKNVTREVAEQLVHLYFTGRTPGRLAARGAVAFASKHAGPRFGFQDFVLLSGYLSHGKVYLSWDSDLFKVKSVLYGNAAEVQDVVSAAAIIERADEAGLLERLEKRTSKKYIREALRFARSCTRRNDTASEPVKRFRAEIGRMAAEEILRRLPDPETSTWAMARGGESRSWGSLHRIRENFEEARGLFEAAEEAFPKFPALRKLRAGMRAALISDEIQNAYAIGLAKRSHVQEMQRAIQRLFGLLMTSEDFREKTRRVLRAAINRLESGEAVRIALKSIYQKDAATIAASAASGKTGFHNFRGTYSFRGTDPQKSNPVSAAEALLRLDSEGLLWLATYRLPDGDELKAMAFRGGELIRRAVRELEIEEEKRKSYRAISWDWNDALESRKRENEIRSIRERYGDWLGWAIAYARGDDRAITIENSRLLKHLPGGRPGVYSARLIGRDIVTSGGARVSASVAKGLARAIRAARVRREPVETPAVDYYGRGKAYPDGSLKIGCHLIPGEVVSVLAEQLGIDVESEARAEALS